MQFSKKVNDFVKQYNGLENAKKIVLKEYKSYKKKDSDLMESHNSFLKSGIIYTFDYNPKHKDVLGYYDMQPLMLCLGYSKTNDGTILEHGLNLNFMLYHMKLDFFDKLFNSYGILISNRIRERKETPFRIDYEFVKMAIGENNLKFCYRTYLPNHRSNTYSFSYNYWEKLMVLDISDFHDITINKLQRLYYMQKLKN